ncbi:hypothetical protein CENSYa_0542 [Cenarchaeum symbiosum A]|uniref:Uncharacterized protein n=1 Tax=Cenarchaeum symbiosum (strain A) TaxID=414004 RepID=A0RV08_CENSY|nr:hypothetical protein CENSYa_0542 [Cenarchaeum symbiosum A]
MHFLAVYAPSSSSIPSETVSMNLLSASDSNILRRMWRSLPGSAPYRSDIISISR